MSPIVQYLTDGKFPPYEGEAKKGKNDINKIHVVARKLYNMERATPIIRCLGNKEITLLLMEVHEGVCESNIGGRKLSKVLLRVGYYWPNILRDSVDFINKCEKRQRFSDLCHVSAKVLHSVTLMWLFYQ